VAVFIYMNLNETNKEFLVWEQ